MTAGKPPLDLHLRCPSCSRPAGTLFSASQLPPSCPCGFQFSVSDGILNAIPAGRREAYARFLEEYSKIRQAEGRGSSDPAFYLALPYADLAGRYDGQWKIRSRTYRYFESRISAARSRSRSLAILDLGAGNCWMCYRLALAGHDPVAVDLNTDTLDGLGAAVHYASRLDTLFPRFEAEFDRLPFEDGQFDLAVFNASFHYSTDYSKTLREARRCLKPPGSVVILDSPTYSRPEFGERMRRERHDFFEKTYGFRSNTLASRDYLYESLLHDLEIELGLRWEIHKPWYGWMWALRPFKSRLLRRRPSSSFRILVGSWARS